MPIIRRSTERNMQQKVWSKFTHSRFLEDIDTGGGKNELSFGPRGGHVHEVTLVSRETEDCGNKREGGRGETVKRERKKERGSCYLY